jgi:hypothetical protein
MWPPITWLLRKLRPVRNYQIRLLRTLSDAWICSYALIAVLLANVVLPRLPQGSEIGSVGLGNYVTADTNHAKLLVVFEVASVLYFAACIWLSGLSALQNSRTAVGSHATLPVSTVPFLLAVLALLSGVELAVAHLPYNAVNILSGIALVYFLCIPLLRKSIRHPRVPHKDKKLVRRAHPAFVRVHSHVSKNRTTYELVLAFFGTIFAVKTITDPIDFPKLVSTWTIIFVALGVWPLIGSRIFIAWFRRQGWPSFWLAPIVLVIVGSIWNDSHEIRTVSKYAFGATYGVPHRALQPFGDALAVWKKQNHCSKDKPCLMRIVAAEGGGLRAAYWTGAVMQELNRKGGLNRKGDFAKSVFAASTVSGGSLGAAAFWASLNANCKDDRFLRKDLGDDYLSPLIAALLFKNAAEWFWPFSAIPGFDRARPFEDNMAAIWEEHLGKARCNTGRNAFKERFAPAAFVRKAPEFFFNSTNVETGKRFIMATVAQPPDATLFGQDSYWAFDPRSLTHLKTLPVAMAVTLSSSFPVVTPAASIYEHDQAGKRLPALWGRVVDGGYFAGTGLNTAFDIINAVEYCNLETEPCSNGKPNPKAEPKSKHDIRYNILFISNDPETAAATKNSRDGLPKPPDPPSREDDNSQPPDHPPILSEAGSIITGQINAYYESLIATERRDLAGLDSQVQPNAGNGITPSKRAVDKLAVCYSLFPRSTDATDKKAPPQTGMCEISLGRVLPTGTVSRPPLGWWLSRASTDNMSVLAKCYVDAIQARETNGMLIAKCRKLIQS